MKESPLEAEAAMLIRAAGLPEPQREYRFATDIGRKWRADFAWPESRLLLEMDGGGFHAGRHHRYGGRQDDNVRDAYCALIGWRVLRADAVLLRRGFVVHWLSIALQGCGWRKYGPSDFPLARELRPREAARRRVKARAKRLDARARRVHNA